MRRDWRRLIAYTWPIRIALGVVFLYAALPKLQDLPGVVQSVRNYNVLPEPLAVVFGYALPFAELTLGLCLVLGLLTRLAAAGGMALMASFLVAIAINLVRGDAPECSCFSVGGGSTLDWTVFGRDVVLFVGMVLPFVDRERWVSLDRWIAGAGEPDVADEGQGPALGGETGA